MSIREAAEALGVGRSTAYALMAQGKLPTVQIGRRRLVPTDSVLAIAKGEAA
jgi:excisionase family DNA binding protein